MQQNKEQILYDTRDLKLARRQALLIELAALDRDLGLKRTIERKANQDRASYDERQQRRGNGEY